MEEWENRNSLPVVHNSQRESIYDEEKKIFFIINPQFWFDFAWPVGITRQILSYRYTIMIFDVVYLSALIIYGVNYEEIIHGMNAGDALFMCYSLLTTIILVLLPPLSIRLLRDAFTSEAIPSLFTLAKQYDQYYHLRVSCLCYLNILGCCLMIIFSTLLDLNPFDSKKVVPWLVVSIIPSGLALSILIAIMEAHRVLQFQFIQSLTLPEQHLSLSKLLPPDEKCSESDLHCVLNPPSSPHNLAVPVPSIEEMKSHFLQLRSQYMTLYHASQAVSRRYGLVILLYVISLVMYSAYLIWFLYLIDDITLSDILPYLTICGGGLIELTFTLTIVNEIGEQIKRELCKHILLYTLDLSLRGTEDASLLLACVQKLTIDIPFKGGFSLKCRHTMVLLGPLIATIIPTIIEKSKKT